MMVSFSSISKCIHSNQHTLKDRDLAVLNKFVATISVAQESPYFIQTHNMH
jgi:hypothetical protein